MAEFVQVPVARVPADNLHALLEEFASRDGTDYGVEETALADRVERLRKQLDEGRLELLFDVSSEQWDLLPTEDVKRLLAQVDAATDD